MRMSPRIFVGTIGKYTLFSLLEFLNQRDVGCLLYTSDDADDVSWV